jgi:glycosyltransferase involved in cell wall biosynthesis
VLLFLLADYGGPYEGSFIPTARALAEGALARGWSARLAFSAIAGRHPWFERLSAESGFEVGLAPAGGRGDLARWIATEISGGPAVLHTHYSRFDLPAAAAARRRARTAVLWHVHTPLYRGARADARNAVKYGLVGRTVSAILASGPDPARSVLRVGAPRRRVEVVGSGVPTGRYTLPDAEERARARERLGLPAAERVLLHFGWDWELKDGDLFLATVDAVAGRPGGGPEVLGVTVSDDPRARAAVDRHTGPGAVRVIEPMEDVRGAYAAADLFVSTSRVEGQPFAVIEAICSGLPVAAGDLPGHRDVCGGLASCRVVRRSPDALAEAAAALLGRDPERASAEAAEARAAVAARFDLGPWAERVLERYERALRDLGVEA